VVTKKGIGRTSMGFVSRERTKTQQERERMWQETVIMQTRKLYRKETTLQGGRTEYNERRIGGWPRKGETVERRQGAGYNRERFANRTPDTIVS